MLRKMSERQRNKTTANSSKSRIQEFRYKMSDLRLDTFKLTVFATLPYFSQAYHYVDGPVSKNQVQDFHCPGL